MLFRIGICLFIICLEINEIYSSCSASPCQNNGLCMELNNETSFSCVCFTGFTGRLCEIEEKKLAMSFCSNQPCLNGGTCQESGSSYVCQCPFQFSGVNCEQTNPCSTNPCQNNGICQVNSANQVTCVCSVGFSGNFCQNTPTSCNCQNGGVCSNDKTYCVCPANYYGKNCNIQFNSQYCQSQDINPLLCSTWKSLQLCSFDYSYDYTPVPIYCPSSCNLCASAISCEDTQASCSVWASFKLCSRITAIDGNLCKRSCNLCPANVLKKK